MASMAWWVNSVVVGLILVLDGTRQVVVQGPPWWTQMLTPAVSLLGIAAAYFLGRQQGKAQTRHDKSVDVAVEVLRKSLLSPKTSSIGLSGPRTTGCRRRSLTLGTT